MNEDKKRIDENKSIIDEQAKKLKKVIDIEFPNIINKAISEANNEQEKDLIRDFAKESGKMINDMFKMSNRSEIIGTLESFKSRYEQRINNS